MSFSLLSRIDCNIMLGTGYFFVALFLILGFLALVLSLFQRTWRRWKNFAENRDLIEKVCKRYSLKYDILSDGRLRLSKWKGNTIVRSKYFRTVRQFKKHFRMDTEWHRQAQKQRKK